jgi:uncharacterized protein with ParB-like and HNH nuclease domain
MSVKEVLSGVHTKEYLLLAIQREFVKDGDQIRRLVDSLMREYPIGSFLPGKVEPGTAHSITPSTEKRPTGVSLPIDLKTEDQIHGAPR